MSSEDRLRELLKDPRWSLPAWPDAEARVRRAAWRQRLTVTGISSIATAAVVAAVAVPLTLLGGTGSAVPPGTGLGVTPSAHASVTPSAPASATSSPPLPPPPRGWVRHADGAGDFIDTPAGWHVSGLPALAAPAVRWVIGTGPVPSGGSCAPAAALRKLPADGALFAVMEYVGVGGQAAAGEPYTFPARARRLGLGPLEGPVECWGVKTHLVTFEDGGRYFQVQAVFGPAAPASLRAQVRRSLNTLRVAPLPAGEQPAALCRAGQWTFCPQAPWVYQVIRSAHVVELGNLGTRAISGLTGNRSFALWTAKPSSGLPGSRCRQISGTTVCRDGNRLYWQVHGLVVWLQAAASPFSTPPVRPGLPPTDALRRLVEASRHVPVAAR